MAGKIELVAPLDGVVTIEPADTASNFTVTIPAVTAELLSNSSGILNIGSGQVYKDASGNVGIGTSSPAAKLDVAGDIKVSGQLTAGASGSVSSPLVSAGYISGTSNMYLRNISGTNRIDSYNDPITATIPLQLNASQHTFYIADAEKMRITSSGNLLVGTATNNTRAPRLALNGGSVTWSVGPSASNSAFVVYNASEQGVFMGSGSTSWSSSSDERLKTDLIPIDDAVEKVKTLRSVTGRFKSDEEGTSRSFLIAQDFLEVFPEAVDSTNPESLGLRYTETIPLLVAAIQELKAELDTVKAELNTLKGN